MPSIGPYSRTDAFNVMDRRTWQAKLLAKTRAELTAHVGGKPSTVQAALIDRAAWLTLYLALLQHRTAAGGAMTDHDSRTYLSWSNTLTKTLAKIGLQGPTEAAPKTLQDHLAQRVRAA